MQDKMNLSLRTTPCLSLPSNSVAGKTACIHFGRLHRCPFPGATHSSPATKASFACIINMFQCDNGPVLQSFCVVRLFLSSLWPQPAALTSLYLLPLFLLVRIFIIFVIVSAIKWYRETHWGNRCIPSSPFLMLGISFLLFLLAFELSNLLLRLVVFRFVALWYHFCYLTFILIAFVLIVFVFTRFSSSFFHLLCGTSVYSILCATRPIYALLMQP